MSIQILDKNDNEISSINSGDSFKVVVDIISHSSIKVPIYALKFRNTKGQIVYGQNTKFARYATKPLKSKDKFRIIFELEANFAEGDYLVSLGFTNYKNGELQVIHRMHGPWLN